MAERPGYIYRHPQATAEQLDALINGMERGWVWSSAAMEPLIHAKSPLAYAEGRALSGDREVRWRRLDDGYDVLMLTVAARELPGFTPLPPSGGGVWRVRPLAGYHLQRGDDVPATAFLASDGAIQFVALLDTGVAEGASDELS